MESASRTVAVATEDDRGLEGRVSAHFGRCPTYTLVTVEGGALRDVRVVPNPNATRHEPGAMPHFIRGLGASAIVAGGMGPRAIAMFESLGIEVATGASGKVADVVAAFAGGHLRGIVPCKHDGGDECEEHGAGGHDGAGSKSVGLVAFSARGPGRDLAAALDPRFGRAERFLLVEPDSGRVVEVVENHAVSQAHGAGPAAAALVAGRGARAVVSGRFGPSAAEALSALGLEAVEAAEATSVQQALEAYRLRRSAGPAGAAR